MYLKKILLNLIVERLRKSVRLEEINDFKKMKNAKLMVTNTMIFRYRMDQTLVVTNPIIFTKIFGVTQED